MVRRRVHIALLGLGLLLGSRASGAPSEEDTLPAQERYEIGLRHMRRGYYTKALEAFNKVRNFHRDDPVSLKAEIAIADLYFKKADYPQARLAYEDFARLHPRSEHLDYVVYRIGLSIFKGAAKFAGRDQTSTQHAINSWTRFDARFPSSEYGEEVRTLMHRARERLATRDLFVARFYARRDAWTAVRQRTRRIVARYPESSRVPEAMALQGRALHARGDVAGATQIRERLATLHPDSRHLARLDHALTQPPGTPTFEETFPRPYRIPGGTAMGPGGR